MTLFAVISGVPMPHSLMVNVFNHSHKYYSLGIRLYFFTIPGDSSVVSISMIHNERVL